MKAIVLILLLAPALALGNADRRVVTTSKISTASPARYVEYSTGVLTLAHGAVIGRYVYPFPGGARLVNVIVYQHSAGTVGTSWTANVRNAATTSLLATTMTATLASGAAQVSDARGDIALPSGWTRAVIKTDGTATIAQGAMLDVHITETGSYSAHPMGLVVLVFEPLQ